MPNLVWLTVYFHPSTSSLCNIVTMQYYRFCCQKSFLCYKRQCSSRTTDSWCLDPKFPTKVIPYTQIDIPENVWKAKGFVFLLWYYIDRGDQENESGFLCEKRFFVEKIVSIQSDHRAVYLDINSLLIADVKWSIFTFIDAGFQSSVSI